MKIFVILNTFGSYFLNGIVLNKKKEINDLRVHTVDEIILNFHTCNINFVPFLQYEDR